MQNNNWKSLKNDYENLSTKPSAELWGKLNNQLDKKDSKSVSKFTLIKMAAVFLLFVTVGVIYYSNRDNENSTSTIENNAKITEKMPAKKAVDFIKAQDENPTKIENLASSLERNLIRNSEKIDLKSKLNSGKPEATFKNISTDLGNSSEKLALKSDLKTKPEIEDVKKIAEVQYVKADELLFARELNRNNNKENIEKKGKMGFIDANGISKPKSVKILGITVYSDPSESSDPN